MVKLQAATVSNKVVRKRKRKTTDDDGRENHATIDADPLTHNTAATHDSTSTGAGTSTIPTKTHDGGSKPRRSTKANGERPTLHRQGSSSVTECVIPWPEHFTRISQTHRALNLVYTFCCTRKHLATTFDNIKSAVESHTKRELSIQDITEIKALIPHAITFAYVEEAKLQVNMLGAEQGSRTRRVGDFPPLDGVGGEDGGGGEVLFFEFIDGDLKRQVAHAKTGEPTKARQKLKHEELKMPVFSQKQMLNLIEKRNRKFTSAINAFLNQCVEDGLEPLLHLATLTQDYMPVPAESRPSTPSRDRDRAAPLPPSIPNERHSIPDIINEIKSLEWYSGQIVVDGHRVFDPQEPVYGELTFALSQSLVNALYNARGITQLYAHQAEAINNLYEGHHVIVSTSTSSGKSLIYQLPVLHALEADPSTRAMYIFPTKALAQDQLRSLQHVLSYMPELQDVLVETFDGDTEFKSRNRIRDEARVIFTNPDMLHLTILPQEEAWRTFLQHLRYVVVDELHVYNGLFGSHVALIMRRLRRICAAVGNRRVRFISCSATVANPEAHMRAVFGVDEVRLTDFDGSPSGRKEFLCWNTPFKDPGDPTSGRGDTLAEAARLFCQLILRGVRVIAFARVRKMCELLLNSINAELAFLERGEVMARVMAYRGGYTPQDRRRIEREMFEGKLVGVVATNALELGIDIGSLDAVVTVGFPYTIANLRQQSGRAGRRNRDSLSVLVGDCFPTDQHYMTNPDEIFTKPNCELQIDLANPLVLEGHVQCAAHELPLRPADDAVYFGPDLQTLADERLLRDDQGYYHCHDRFRPQPSRHVAIRDTENDHFAVVDVSGGRNAMLEELEASRAFFTLYEGGIFLHQGRTYLVKTFSQDRMLAEVEHVRVDWTTQQRDYTDIDPVETEQIRRIPGSLSRAFFGPIRVVQVVFGFFKLDKKRRILDAVEVDNPPIVIMSKGMWLDVPRAALEILNSRRLNVAAAIHAAEHAMLSLMPNYVISMPGDVRTECKYSLKEFQLKETQRKRPARLTFYDAKGGAQGSGISTKAFEFVDLLLRQACGRVEACRCDDGCLECCCSERCRDANQVMSKAGAEVILKSLLNREIDVDALPWGPEEAVPAYIETVIAAEEVRPRRGAVVRVVEVKREGGGVERVVVGTVAGEDAEADAEAERVAAQGGNGNANAGATGSGVNAAGEGLVVIKDEPLD